MKPTTLTRAASALIALAIAVPALPCGLMQHEAASTTSTPAVAEAQKTAAQPKTAEKAPKAVKQAKKTTVAKN